MATYRVVVEGDVLPGFAVDEVRRRLAALIGRNDEVAAKLLGGAGGPSRVKKGVDKATALRYVETLKKIGVACHVEQEILGLDLDAPQFAPPASVAVATPREVSFVVSEPEPKTHPPKKRISRSVKVLLVMTGVLLIGSAMLNRTNPPAPSDNVATEPASPRPEQAKTSADASNRRAVKLICGKSVSSFHDAVMEFDIGGVNGVNVTFLAQRPSKADIDRALRECLAEAIKVDGRRDILANAFFRAREGNNPDDDELLTPYGFLTSLVYVASNKSIGIHKAEKVDPANASRGAKLEGAAAGALALKRAMKDPEAFELTSLVMTPNGTACYEYRAKNSFGAILPSSAVRTPSGKMLTREQNGNTFVAAWNKECATKGGEDITTLVKMAGILK